MAFFVSIASRISKLTTVTLVREVYMSTDIKIMSLINVDTDEVLFKSLLGVILLAALWPLGFLGYLVTVYGTGILMG
jgi:hypothetical protein